MSTNTRLGSCIGRSSRISVVALLALAPAVAGAQPVPRTPDPARADALHQEAQQLIRMQSSKNWKEAARLLERAAPLRAAEDTLAIAEQAIAGELMHYLGWLPRAQANLAGAAERALRLGRVLESAQLFLKAAFVAHERGAPAEADRFVRSARQLAGSPYLSPAQRDAILTQIRSDASVGRRAGY